MKQMPAVFEMQGMQEMWRRMEMGGCEGGGGLVEVEGGACRWSRVMTAGGGGGKKRKPFWGTRCVSIKFQKEKKGVCNFCQVFWDDPWRWVESAIDGYQYVCVCMSSRLDGLLARLLFYQSHCPDQLLCFGTLLYTRCASESAMSALSAMSAWLLAANVPRGCGVEGRHPSTVQ
jgi:hypothetical protein